MTKDIKKDWLEEFNKWRKGVENRLAIGMEIQKVLRERIDKIEKCIV